MANSTSIAPLRDCFPVRRARLIQHLGESWRALPFDSFRNCADMDSVNQFPGSRSSHQPNR
jgi:hypothetical protein